MLGEEVAAGPGRGTAAGEEWLKCSRSRSSGEAIARIDFARINAAALARLPDVVARWLPDGWRSGDEWVARNPVRHDRRPGSFKVNLRTGKWADFATSDRGGDPVSLAAYLFRLTQVEAARRLAAMVGVSDGR